MIGRPAGTRRWIRQPAIPAGGDWGVETFMLGGKEYVAASDRDFGLYLYEYTPVNAAP